MIPQLRNTFNENYAPLKYSALLSHLEQRSGGRIEFRIAETPIFVPKSLLDEMASEGVRLAQNLIGDQEYLAAARNAIPAGYRVAAECSHPHFLTADFALVRDARQNLSPKLVEIQAFPSVYGYQAVLAAGYRDIFQLDKGLGMFLGGLNEDSYFKLLAQTILGDNDPENVVLTEIDPQHQKTRPDFVITAKKTGIAVVDITSLVPLRNKLHYRNNSGRLVPIDRIYNRAIVDELIARNINLPFDLTHPWDVKWAGHPNWYFLISKFSLPWLCRQPGRHPVVPPAVFLNDFLAGPGREALRTAGVEMPVSIQPGTAYNNLLLKPLFSFAGKGIQFDPTQAELEAIPEENRGEFLLQQRMTFVPTIETPYGLTQAEIRILYLWPDRGNLIPAMSLVRLGRGKMMGVDHNKNQEWVGASAAFFPV